MSFPAIEGAEILAAGVDLKIPERSYRRARAAHGELGEGRPIYEALAAAHGAVLFRLRPAYEDEDPVFGVVLRVAGSWAILERDGACAGVAADAALEPATSWCFFAFLSEPPGEEPDVPGVTSFVLEDPRRAGAWASDHWRLCPHPMVGARAQRDWVWISPGSYGNNLVVRLERSAAEIAAWLATFAPLPYVPVAANRYAIPDDHHQLAIFDGGLRWFRGYHDPPGELVALDGSLVSSLAGGALGELTWDVIDEDHGNFLASGDDAASLRDYLDPQVAAGPQQARWAELFTVRRFDGRAARSPGELVAALSSYLCGTPVAAADFQTWLASRPLATLPRCLEVAIATAMIQQHGLEWLWTPVHAAQPRTQWSVRQV